MSITQLAFQAVVAQNLIEENDYKVHNLEGTNELTGKTIDDIWDAINGGSDGDIVERIEVLENIAQNITSSGIGTMSVTSISNTLNVIHVIGFYDEDIIYKIPSITLLGGDNGPNTNYGMYASQSGSNLDLFLAEDDVNLLSTVHSTVKKLNFQQIVILLEVL
jgi:hypothetical protein